MDAIRDARGHIIAYVESEHAALFAAAPALLDACRQALSVLESNAMDWRFSTYDAKQALRDAIAAAGVVIAVEAENGR